MALWGGVSAFLGRERRLGMDRSCVPMDRFCILGAWRLDHPDEMIQAIQAIPARGVNGHGLVVAGGDSDFLQRV